MARGILVALAVLGTSGTAIGQPSGRGEPGVREDQTLRGPRVAEGEQPEGRGQFVRDGRRGASRDALEFRMVQRILGAMASDSAEPEIRLSEAQTEGLREVAESHRASVAAYFVDKRGEIARHLETLGLTALADRVTSDDADGDRIAQSMARAPRELAAMATSDEMAMSPQSEETERARRREFEAVLSALTEPQRQALRSLNVIQSEAPSMTDATTRAMALLSDRQREYVRETLERSRARLGQGRGAGEEMSMLSDLDAQGAMSEDGRPARRDRLSRLIAQLSPDQREALADYIEQRLRIRGRDGRREGGEPKPPPSMDEVDLPPPGQ